MATFEPKCDKNIFKLAQNGDIAGVEGLIEEGHGVNEVDAMGSTPLILAARNGHVSLVKILLGQGATVEAATYGGMRALHFAANALEEPTIIALLEEGKADINAPDGEGQGAIHWAASRGVLGTIVVFVDHGADINMVSGTKTTPLMRAVANSHGGVVQRLLKLNAKHDQADVDGNTALHLACRGQSADIVEALLAAGADKGAKNKLNKTPQECTTDALVLQCFPTE